MNKKEENIQMSFDPPVYGLINISDDDIKPKQDTNDDTDMEEQSYSYKVDNQGNLVMMEVQEDEFFHAVQVLKCEEYKSDQLESLRKLFTIDEGHEEKLRIMRLEQDAAAKQKIIAGVAKKSARNPY